MIYLFKMVRIKQASERLKNGSAALGRAKQEVEVIDQTIEDVIGRLKKMAYKNKPNEHDMKEIRKIIKILED